MDVWSVPHTYACDHSQLEPLIVELDGETRELHSPCKTDESVYCYVNRYREKTIVLIYMVIFTVFSITLTVVELFFFTFKYCFNTHKHPSQRTGLALKRYQNRNKTWKRTYEDIEEAAL